MGQSQSSEPPKHVPIEQLSHQLALRFASKCYNHLEIAHYKDNFKSLADHQEDVEYWKEDTLGRFLALPEPLQAGPVLYHMCTYLGAFPFPSLSPCILTRENMLKVVTLMTGRYKKVLKRGDQDKVKLLFRSMAIFDRRTSVTERPEKPSMDEVAKDQLPSSTKEERTINRTPTTHFIGFEIDRPSNDDEEEDDDDLVLAALDSLDAIEVFKHDQKTDRKIHHAQIPAENLKKLITLLLLVADVEPLTSLGSYGEKIDYERLQTLSASADAIVAAFDPDQRTKGIKYSYFVQTIATTLPDLFDPLSPLFEHFLFSKNIDLSRHKNAPPTVTVVPPRASPIYRAPEDTIPTLLTDTLLAQLSTTLKLHAPSGSLQNIYTSSARFNNIYSSATHGTSLSSFSRQVQSWTAGTILLVSGSFPSSSVPIVLGAYLPSPWPTSSSPPPPSPDAPPAALFQLSPRQAIFPATPHHPSHPYFSARTGIALGCVIPPQPRTGPAVLPILGPASLTVDASLETVTFQHDGAQGTGAFMTDVNLEAAQADAARSDVQPKRVTFDVDALEVWGVSFASASGEDDEVAKQAKRLAWEEAEAARRRGVNFGGDKDGARALLEMAGLAGDKAQNRSGGSV